MLGTPRIITTRKDIDTRTGKLVDMSFDTNNPLHMFVTAKRRTSDGSITHGLLYEPEFMIMKELPDNWEEDNIDYYDIAGSREWVCPPGVSEVRVICIGGGGAGGGLVSDNVVAMGGGGAGGQYAEKTFSVTAGTSYTVTVGAGGVGGTGNGGNGGDSQFESTVVAKGGAGGKSYENGGSAGQGSVSGGVGSIVRRGGSGSNGGSTTDGGAGGGAGGSSANGGDASGSDGGLGGADNGYDPYPMGTGNGASTYSASMDGFAGEYYGGGGAGGLNAYDFYTTDRLGGDGGGGVVIIIYTRRTDTKGGMCNCRSSYAKATSTTIDVVKGDEYKAVWAYSKLSSIKNEPSIEMNRLVRKGYPFIAVGNEEYEPDRKKKVHTYYPTLTIQKTGTLTINKPSVTYHNGDQLVEVTEVSYEHNLGYIPMFAPFVDYHISLPVYYDWLAQYYDRGEWASGVEYYLKETVIDNEVGYECTQSHTSSSTNRPNSGVDWHNYWKVVTEPTSYNTVLNEMEDIKFIYGGVEVFNNYIVDFYATSTKLILRLTRIQYDFEGMFLGMLWDNVPLWAVNLSVDFTIFSNRADMEYNMLQI